MSKAIVIQRDIMHKCCGLLGKSRHGTVIQLSSSCLVVVFSLEDDL